MVKKLVHYEMPPFIDHLLDHSQDDNCLSFTVIGQELSPLTLTSWISELKQFNNKHLKFANRDANLLSKKQRQLVRCMIGISPYETDMAKYLEN